MTSTAEGRRESAEELSRGFLEHAGRLLHAQEQTDWHLRVEATEVIEDILGTLNESGPYGYTVSPDLEDGRLRLTEAQNAESQQAWFHLGVEHATNSVSLFRPDVKHAFSLTGDGVTRIGEVEEQFAVFQNNDLGIFGEEGLE